MASELLARRILQFVQEKGYEPRAIGELAAAMGVGENESGDFRSACRALMKTGRIVLGAQNAITVPAPPGRVVGRFRSNPRGFGFVIPDTPHTHGDLYIPSGKTAGAMTGDTVEARVLKRGKRGGTMLHEGRITEIIKRGHSRFVGELRRTARQWYVLPDGNTLHVPILVDDPTAKGANPQDQVVVEILQYPQEGQDARGVIVKVLGPRGEPDVDTLSIIEQYELPGEFEEGVLQNAHDAVARFDPKKDAKDREDLTRLTTITIDPADARDFDDAISLQEDHDGAWVLGVHIADVAAFVPADSPLDREARERSNSVYLPRMVIPMLPEVLSNGVCSLQEHQPRLTKSALITYDRRGRVKGARCANTVIRSTKRLTYEQAGAVLEGRKIRMSAKVVALLKSMEKLARVIRHRRLRAGMLELELPDIELVFDREGHVVDVKPEDTGFAHKIIEMFMVEANEAVARLLTQARVPHLRRIHPDPRATSSTTLCRFLSVLGYSLPENADRADLQKLLEKVKGKDESFAVNLAVLRSMQAAEYAPKLTGHYALASEAYCHFTSPIRRYADLTIHRLIDQTLDGSFKSVAGRKNAPDHQMLEAWGRLCTRNEQRAEAAERELKLVLLLRHLEQFVGESFNGIVTGVVNMGVFVQLERYLVDGLLRFDQLGDDWWEVDAKAGCVLGQRTGRRVTVGDRLRVTIIAINIAARQMELSLAEPLAGGRLGKRSKAHKTKHGKVPRRVREKAARPKKRIQASRARGRRRR